MSDLLIRNIPIPLKDEIAKSAKAGGESLSTKAIDLLQKGLIAEREKNAEPQQSAWHVLRSIFDQDGPPDGEFAKIMDEVEADRKRDFGRPVEFGSDDDE